MPFPWALHGRMAVEYAVLLVNYAELASAQDSTITEAQEHEGVVDPLTIADVDLAREAVQNRLCGPEMVPRLSPQYQRF